MDWSAYAACVPGVRDEGLRLEMSFAAALHLDKKTAGPIRKYLSGRARELGELLISSGQIEVFSRYLELLKPSRKILEDLLSLCNREGKTAFIPYLLEQTGGKGAGREYSL